MSDTFLRSYIEDQINRSIVRTLNGVQVCHQVRFTSSKTLQNEGYSESEILDELCSGNYSVISTEDDTLFAMLTD
jgi:hypothetical protein